MRKNVVLPVVAASVAALTMSLTSQPATAVPLRPCGPPAATKGHGTKGTPFTLKSMYDDDGPQEGVVVVGEEFEILTQVSGQVWDLVFTYNRKPFFTGKDTSKPSGIREVRMTRYLGGKSHVAAHAKNEKTGEVIDGAVDLPVAPPGCGRGGED
ncbi:hypothetical protein ACFORO_36150 [Amycolatopsis halotolerans]|uniref:Lipoprotein n=1 Tax=Amycolatopsis halotolerans TaxID=330083 RepID=A0ABV7QQP9_9PSEU